MPPRESFLKLALCLILRTECRLLHELDVCVDEGEMNRVGTLLEVPIQQRYHVTSVGRRFGRENARCFPGCTLIARRIREVRHENERGAQTHDRTDFVKVLPAQTFKSCGVQHNRIHCPLGKEELVQAVVGDLRNGDGTGTEPR